MLTRFAPLLAAFTLALGCEPTNEGYAPEQPISYSHALHAGALQIDCQYCHYGASQGPLAGIPPASICMNCHQHVAKDRPEIIEMAARIESGEPVEWVRVNWLPDHVYFNHSVHVNVDVSCQTCHGEVQEMGRLRQAAPLTMGWCLGCHRDVEEDTTGALQDCAVCHH